MTINLIKTILILLTPLYSVDTFAQISKVLFSTTGDTVCYSNIFGQQIDSMHTRYTVSIDHSVNSIVKNISKFEMLCEYSNTCLENLKVDDLKKYNLENDCVNANVDSNRDFVMSIQPTIIRFVDTSAFGPKNIYLTNLSVYVSCKGVKLYSKEFEVMFKGNTPEDFPIMEFVKIRAWRKNKTKKYFIDLSVKEFQTYKKPGDAPEYSYQNFKFIL